MATFVSPEGVCVDASNNVYTAEYSGYRIRKTTPTGMTSLVAGTGVASALNGALTSATFNSPSGCVFDSAGNMYVADHTNSLVRKITFSTGLVSTFAGTTGVAGSDNGFGTYAKFNNLYGFCIDSSDNMYVPDTMSHIIRKITSGAIVTKIAGSGGQSAVDGAATSATFNQPGGCAVDNVNSRLYIADTYNHKIRAITLTGTMTVTTHAGTGSATYADGAATSASFHFPIGAAVNSRQEIIIGDAYNRRVRLISGRFVSSLGGTGTPSAVDGFSTAASFGQARQVDVDSNDNIYVADYNGNSVRKIITCSGGATFDKTLLSCVCGAGLQLNPNNTCSSCPDGYYQSLAGTSSCTQCAAGTETAANRQSCTTCAAGKYRDLTMSSCQTCAAGSEVLLNQTGCSTCTYGRIRSAAMSSCSDCSIGFEAAANKSVCVACVSGYYRPSLDYLKCAPCPPLATCSSSVIIGCQSGYKISAGGNSCEQCPIGTQSSGDYLSCVSCTLGSNYRSSLTQSSCQTCPTNAVCGSVSSFTCNAGYEPTADGTGCQICGEGYSKSATGNIACTQCAIGTESAANKQSCTSCSSGKYRPSTLVNKCIPCPQNGVCTAAALTCNAGYKLNSNGDGCDQCPIGQQSDGGFTSCVSCTSGTNYRSSLTQSTCQACPSNAACTPTGFTCNAGFELSADGSGCQACQEGYSKAASGNAACTQCTLGTESAADRQSCVTCGAGKYRLSQNFNKCIPCPQNGQCSASSLTRCSNGYKKNVADDGCEQCPLGQDSTDGVNCQGCSIGYFKPSQSFDMCVACPNGASNCGGALINCQNGYYFDSSLQCKRNDTYFDLQATAPAAGAVTVTAYLTLTQTTTSTSSVTTTSTTSIFYTATAIQTQSATLAANTVSLSANVVTLPIQTFSVTQLSTQVVTASHAVATVVVMNTVFLTASTTADSVTTTLEVANQGASNSSWTEVGISPVLLGFLMFFSGVAVVAIAALLFMKRNASMKVRPQDAEFLMTTTKSTDTSAAQTFVTQSFTQ